jgi:predicted dehydrogenase
LVVTLGESRTSKEAEVTRALRWGIIGTGAIARTFAGDLRLIDEGVVVAVGSRSLESANSFADEFDVAHRFGSYEELVRDPDVDAVYVATPHPMHRDHAILALEQGKHVLVEKAFTMNATQAREIVTLARKRQLFLMEAMWTRFLPHVVALRELLAEDVIGPIVSVEADHGQWFAADPYFRLFAPELGGSALLDLGIYPVSFASMILGPPQRIVALVDPSFTGVDGQTSMLFGYESGAHAILTCTSRARSATRACITGERARIEIDGDFYAPTSFTVIERSGEARRFEFPTEGRGLQYEAREVARCIEEGLLESPWMPLDESVSLMQTMDTVLGFF